MIKTIPIIILLAILSSCSPAEQPIDKPIEIIDKISEQEALDLLHRWTDAYLSGDATPLDDILDETWIYSGSEDGNVTGKSAAIEEFSNADYKFHEISYDDLNVHVYQDIAVLRGSERMVILGNTGSDTTVLRLRFTDVYQKKDGKVKAIATHSSPISE